MKKLLLFFLFIIPSFCFAEFYGEYSFEETDNIKTAYLNGNGWNWSEIFRWTKTDIQNEINQLEQARNPLGREIFFAHCMRLILKASADKRIFIIDYTVSHGPYCFLFIKINENEYVVFFTGL